MGLLIADMCIIVAIESDGALSQIPVRAAPPVSLESSSYASQARPMDRRATPIQEVFRQVLFDASRFCLKSLIGLLQRMLRR